MNNNYAKIVYEIDTCGQYYESVLSNYLSIGITWVKIIGKYAAGGVNYAKKVL
jgi:hypothetical protein